MVRQWLVKVVSKVVVRPSLATVVFALLYQFAQTFLMETVKIEALASKFLDPLRQRWKLCGKLGRSFPVGLGTSSRILRGSPMVFVLSRNFAVTYAIFWIFLGQFA